MLSVYFIHSKCQPIRFCNYVLFLHFFFRKTLRGRNFSKLILKLGTQKRRQKNLPTHLVLWISHLMFQKALCIPQKIQLILKLTEHQIRMPMWSTLSWRNLFQAYHPLQTMNLCLLPPQQKWAQFQTKIMHQV